MAPKVIPLSEAAKYLKVSVSRAKRLADRGELPTIPVGPGRYRYVREADLDDILRAWREAEV